MAGVARFEDLRVAAEPLELFVERLHFSAGSHRVAQQVAEVAQELACLAWILRHETGDGVERIEQEMRLEMRAELRQLRLGTELVSLERTKARVLHDEGQDEHQRPEREVAEPDGEAHAEDIAF